MNRRSFIKRGSLYLPPLFAIGRARGQVLTLSDPASLSRTRKQSSGGVETLWIEQTAVTDYNDMNRQFAQKIKVPGAKEVSKVSIYFFQTGSRVVRIGLWSASDATGTQYGSWSDNETIPNTSSAGWVEFTFGTNPAISADCYVIIDPVSGSGAYISYKDTASGTAYEDNTYTSYDNQIGSVQEPNRDRVFRIYTLE